MFDAYLTFQAGLKPKAMAIITPDRWATYAELEDDVNRFAGGLRALGVTPQAVAAASIGVDNPYLKHVTFLALARLGVVSAAGGDPGADLRIIDGRAQPGVPPLMLTPEWIATTLDAEPVPVVPVRGPPDTIVRIMLSSGTTSRPRRVGKTWRAMEGSAHTGAMTHLSVKGGRWVGFTGMDTQLGQNIALTAWATGSTLVTGLTPELLARDLESLQPTIIGMTPIQLRVLLDMLPAETILQPQLRLVISGSALPKQVAQQARLRIAAEIWTTYGATETGSIAMANGAWLDQTAGIAGRPMPGVRVDITDADGVPVAQGESGEVRVTSERVADGYIGDPEATAAAFRHGGFYPGDIGRFTADGMLVIEGRKDERMNLGGLKFLPNWLEDVAMDCPGVVDAAAFAAPGDDGIDQCWLAVVTAEGFDRAKLAGMLEPRGRNVPRVRFAWTETIPRNAMGKIERDRLRTETIAVLGSPSA